MPATNYDETSKGGTRNVTIELMIELGWLEWVDAEHTKLRAPPNSRLRLLFLFGDQLSVSHVEAMVPYLVEMMGSEYTAGNAREAAKALDSVLRMAGDLHIPMHILDALFRMCYGGFLQAFQAALGWTRLKKKPIDCVQLARRIVRFVLAEGQRYELDLWLAETESIEVMSAPPVGAANNTPPSFETLSLDPIFRKDETKAALGSLVLDRKKISGRAPYVVQAIADSLACFRLQLEESADPVVKFTAQFLSLAEKLFEFEDSVEKKDSIALEVLLNELAPFYAASFKHLYVKLAAGAVETNYAAATALQRETYRLNRCVRLNEGSGAIGMDALLELINAWDKMMEESAKDETHIMKSHYLSLLRRARHTLVHWAGQDPTEIDSSTAGREVQERLVVYRLLRRSGSLKQRNGRAEADLDNNWWDHVFEVRQAKSAEGPAWTAEQTAIANLFLGAPVAAAKDVEEEEKEDEEDDVEDVQEDEEGGGGGDDSTAQQLARIERLKKARYEFAYDRALGDWSAKGAAKIKPDLDRRDAKRAMLQRMRAQIEEALKLKDDQRAARVRAAAAAATTIFTPSTRPDWMQMDADAVRAADALLPDAAAAGT
mmetsp:Transcript_36880/g.99215  ORF Transcript_36880/g.99215 Transcript_36880/m.99215 type:complete len:602 (-) Transcript_36880:155-1960(-)